LRVNAVLARLQSERRRHPSGGPLGDREASRDPFHYAEYGFSIVPEQGNLIYLLCRGLRTKRVAEFATSIGMSTIYLAAAVRDNGS
jgi:predicted O-methyltransferase YrrM